MGQEGAAEGARQELPVEDEVGREGEREVTEWEPSTAGSSPGVSEPGSATNTAASTPVPTRPPSPTTERRRRVYEEDDAGSDDEKETVGDMVSRLLQKQKEAERAYERRRSITVRGALNARTGLTYMMRVGEVEPAEHGRGHERRKAAEGGRVGRATAAEVGVGPMPRPRALRGGCAVCGEKCTPQHVVMAECTACSGSRAGYLERLTKALEEVAKAVPKVTMERSTPMAQWCRLRPIVRKAVEAVQRRTHGDLTTEDAWEAVRHLWAQNSGNLRKCDFFGAVVPRTLVSLPRKLLW